MAAVAKTFTKLESLEDKRRKKSSDEQLPTPKPLVLPQKKRVLPPNPSSSPVKKSQRLSTSSSSVEENAADETLIRETEAALKNLGSWPGTRGSYCTQNEESPAFENLFDEKKSAVKMSPSSASNSSTDNPCSLKDVITLREDEKSDTTKSKVTTIKQEVIEDCKDKGPFPAEATFVGYPNIEQTVSSDDKPKNILKPVEAASESVPVKSPEAANKQYTILQPASMRSRAANVLQESSRDNSSNITSDSEGSKGPVTTATGTLSPNSMGRGKQRSY
ncbi:hypothetical protein YQE_11980, partial [Dendroctonus ponderosae]